MGGGQRGAESLELVAAMPLAALAVLVLWQGVVTVHRQLEADQDARTLVRQVVLCHDAGAAARLADVDPAGSAGGWAGPAPAPPSMAAVTVRLPLTSVVPGVDMARLGLGSVTGTATMRREPC
jgi:hypothetical protein